MSYRGTKYNVLFLGNSNTARSIMAEAILNREGRDNFRAYSAGIHAHVELDPRTVDLLMRSQFDITDARPKNWSEFAGDSALNFDFVISVCEGAALLPRSVWHGNPVFAHWGMPNPAFAEGDEAQLNLVYADTFRMLSNRIGTFVNLPLCSLDRLTIQCDLNSIGKVAVEQQAVGAA